MIETVIVVEFTVESRGGNDSSCFQVEVWTNTAKFRNVIVTIFRNCSYLIREVKMFGENKIKLFSVMRCSE